MTEIAKKHILHFVTPLENVSPFDVNMAANSGFDIIVPYTRIEVAGLAPGFRRDLQPRPRTGPRRRC